MIAGPDGYVRAGLVNPEGFGFYVRYRQRELPCFNEWKMMGEGVYAVGIEPATNWVTGRAKERERGALQILQPGEQRRYHLEFGLLTGLEEAAKFERLIVGERRRTKHERRRSGHPVLGLRPIEALAPSHQPR
jgi:hypothetical protein